MAVTGRWSEVTHVAWDRDQIKCYRGGITVKGDRRERMGWRKDLLELLGETGRGLRGVERELREVKEDGRRRKSGGKSE